MLQALQKCQKLDKFMWYVGHGFYLCVCEQDEDIFMERWCAFV
jgi:hypothetical protein